MARDKQLVIRLEGEIRDKFKQLCQSHDLEMSSFVYSLICRFVDGSIPIEDLAQSTASGLDSEEIATLKKSLMAEVDAKIAAAIASLKTNSGPVPELEGAHQNGSNISQTVLTPEVGEIISPTKEGGLNHKAISELYSQEGKPKALATVRGWANPENKDKPRTTPDKRFTYDPELRLWFETKEAN